MALKIRLARAGAKKRPYYHIVVADVRAPRDGRFIEAVGSWNPTLAKDAERVKLDASRASWTRPASPSATPATIRTRPSRARRRRSASPCRRRPRKPQPRQPLLRRKHPRRPRKPPRTERGRSASVGCALRRPAYPVERRALPVRRFSLRHPSGLVPRKKLRRRRYSR